jgi:hypothetical protein
MKFKTRKIVFRINQQEFINAFGRAPTSQKEFAYFCAIARKGLSNGHIYWDIVFSAAKHEIYYD